jgi:cytochrome c-type biogenesis protein CcmH
MSPAFIAVAAALTLGVIALVAVPLVRTKGSAGPAPLAAFCVSALLLAGAVALYLAFSNFSWKQPAADAPQTMVARLARRLERDPDDLDGWLLLGRSQIMLEQYPLALRAFDRANRLAEGRNAEALIGLGEALALTDDEEIAGRAGDLFERALELDPQSGKALFFGAATALRRNELPLARERFTRLLALDPPANVRPILEQQIELIDRTLAQSQDEGAAKGTAVRVDVDIAPGLRDQVGDGTPLFVIVRDPASPGPPIAVKRLTALFPQSVELTSADAMIAGGSFAAGQDVQVIARLARSGSATARSGDPFGEVRYHVGRDRSARILIDRVTP